MGTSRFLLELIKPSHYDDDGYVIQWWKAWIPSNSLSSVYGLALDAIDRHVLGPDVHIEVEAYDETNTVIPSKRIIRRFQANDNQGIVCLVGVQTNQYPRALDIAREFRQAGIPVAIGGFHVSGCMAMLPELPQELQAALEMGITLYAGETEGRLDDFLAAAHEHRLEPVYNHLSALPSLQTQPTPFLPEKNIRRYAGALGCFDAGRGCPFTCSFCTIINVQGRKSRFRDADDIERLIRAHAAQGVERYFITDDNFARNKNWEAVFDRIIDMREREGFNTNFIIQVDTLCHKIPNFVTKASRAGCKRVFIGLENINPDSLKTASKGQNHITEYRTMLQAWRQAGVITYCGYILGFPTDTPESIERDIRIIQRELPLDMLEFFILTPLPGSLDHQALHQQGVWMDPDMNKYDLEHVTTAHPTMSATQLEEVYDNAWHLYYSWEHIETLFKRGVASGVKPARLASMIFSFYGSYVYEKLHPLQSGVYRRKIRTQRRYGLPRENPLVFYPRRLWEILSSYLPGFWFFWKLTKMRKRIQHDPRYRNYSDVALTQAKTANAEHLELFEVTEAARKNVAKVKARQERARKAKSKAG